jgi:hypothetical protein
MNTADIIRAARQYLDGFDSHDPIEAIAVRGTSEEDDIRLVEAYGEDAASVAAEIQRQCRERIGGAAIRALETAHAAALHDRIVQAVVDDGLAEYSTTGLGHYIRGGWLICTCQNRYLMVGRRSVGAVRVDQDGVIISRIGETPPRRYCTPGFCFEVPGMAIGQAIPSPLDISAAKSGQKMMPWAG